MEAFLSSCAGHRCLPTVRGLPYPTVHSFTGSSLTEHSFEPGPRHARPVGPPRVFLRTFLVSPLKVWLSPLSTRSYIRLLFVSLQTSKPFHGAGAPAPFPKHGRV